jgi:DNA-binding YbaB/EbfC family protein
MDMNTIMQQAKQLQEKMQQVQEELGRKTVSSSAGGGMVTATVNGRQELLSIQIEKTVIDPEEAGMLQDLVVAAVNDAMRKAKEMAQAEMGQLAGGMNIPGLF